MKCLECGVNFELHKDSIPFEICNKCLGIFMKKECHNDGISILLKIINKYYKPEIPLEDKIEGKNFIEMMQYCETKILINGE